MSVLNLALNLTFISSAAEGTTLDEDTRAYLEDMREEVMVLAAFDGNYCIRPINLCP